MMNENNINLENLNGNSVVTSFQELTEANLMFDYNENDDDDVFESSTTKVIVTREQSMRRVSDVIDSIGNSPVSKHGNFDFTEKAINELTERSIRIYHRDIKYGNLSFPPRVGMMGSVTDSASPAPVTPNLITSPPITPGSDRGYCSAGMTTPPVNLVFRPRWLRHSASSCEPSPTKLEPSPSTKMEVPASPIKLQSASPPKLDALDAQIFTKPTEDKQPDTSPTSVTSKPIAQAPVNKYSLQYNMSHPRTGHALIFNHEEFAMETYSPRLGSKLDANRLGHTLNLLGFSVEIHHDLSSDKIVARLNDLAQMDHSESDCILVAVLSHGLGTSFLLARDYPYSVEKLWLPFTPDRCPSLAGKPKMFIIQACRGDKLDGGVNLIKQTQVDSDSSETYRIPAMADFLLAYSTTEGFYSWRNPQKGTWFIQCLCDVLEKEAFEEDFQTIMILVAQKVALDHESFSDIYPWQHQQKQVPQTVSTLIRKVRFQQKQPLSLPPEEVAPMTDAEEK